MQTEVFQRSAVLASESDDIPFGCLFSLVARAGRPDRALTRRFRVGTPLYDGGKDGGSVAITPQRPTKRVTDIF